MQKTSKVKEIKSVNESNGNYGTIFYFNISLENGDTGSVGKKNKDAIKVGQELTYELVAGEKGNRIKEVKPFNKGVQQPFKKEVENRNNSFALSYSKDLAMKFIEVGRFKEPKDAVHFVKETYKEFFNILESSEIKEVKDKNLNFPEPYNIERSLWLFKCKKIVESCSTVEEAAKCKAENINYYDEDHEIRSIFLNHYNNNLK